MWIRFWAKYKFHSGNREEEYYFWADNPEDWPETSLDAECLEWAKNTNHGRCQEYGHGFRFDYEGTLVKQLPENIRTQKIEEYFKKIEHAKKMLRILYAKDEPDKD